jgi:hypothetical protein
VWPSPGSGHCPDLVKKRIELPPNSPPDGEIRDASQISYSDCFQPTDSLPRSLPREFTPGELSHLGLPIRKCVWWRAGELPRSHWALFQCRIFPVILREFTLKTQGHRMTSLIGWIGVDSHGAASAYFASDSRISWPGAVSWDHGRKLFACRRYPHILGYCGDVLFPTQTLSQVTELIDAGLLTSLSDNVDEYTEQIVSIISSALNTYPSAAKQKFDLLYCMREGERVPSLFHLRQITFDPSANPYILSIKIPDRSGAVAVLGSGSQSVSARLDKWASSDVGGTSRAVFSAFCDSLRSGADPRSGGPPQLVGLWRKSQPRTFGMIWQQRRYFYGMEVGATETASDVCWYNELFEVCSPDTLARKPDAQPQPRPRGI